jgi:hypothetical protein
MTRLITTKRYEVAVLSALAVLVMTVMAVLFSAVYWSQPLV